MRTVSKQAASFNTHQVIKRLVAKGIKEAHAEEIVEAILEGRNTDLSQLATKEQLTELKSEMRTGFANAKTDLERTKIQLITWLGGFIVAAASIILGFLQFFHH